MGKKSFHKVAITKKNFRLGLAALGLLAAWLMALTALILTSTYASANKSFYNSHGFAKNSVAKIGAAAGFPNMAATNGARPENANRKTINDRPIVCTYTSPFCDLRSGVSGPQNSNESDAGISVIDAGRPLNATDNHRYGGTNISGPDPSSGGVPGIFGNEMAAPFGGNFPVQNGVGSSNAADLLDDAVLDAVPRDDPSSANGDAGGNMPSFGTGPSSDAKVFYSPDIVDGYPRFESAQTTPDETHAVPEPSMISLFATGLVAAAFYSRARRIRPGHPRIKPAHV